MPTFDPNFPTQIQVQDYTCSVRTVMMMLDSIGIEVTPAEAQDAMVPKYVTPALGLLNRDGSGIVAVLRERWGVQASNQTPATFDAVAACAGKMPVGLGLPHWAGRDLGHWSAVRGFDGARLILANPAGTGPQFGHQTLTREEFDARGPASLVVIPVASVQEPTMVLRGIDVSSHQGAVDWAAVAASGIAFGITKFTGGTVYSNPTRMANWNGMKAHGLVRGAYHYAFESSVQPLPGAGPEAEADYFLSRVEPLGLEPGDVLALDIEDGSGQLGDWCLRWCKRVEQRVGFKPFIYTGAWFSVPHGLGSVPELAQHPLWLAAYQATLPKAPPPWSSVAMWQHTDKGQVPGVAGNCDLNQFFGTREQLLALGKPGAAPQPVPSPYTVGQGILDRMAALGDAPASSEVYGEFWSEAMGVSGRIYRWIKATNCVHDYPPAV